MNGNFDFTCKHLRMTKILKMKKAIKLRMKDKPVREGCFVLTTALFRSFCRLSSN